jgi:DNA-binding FrmR family transcriptional regulator
VEAHAGHSVDADHEDKAHAHTHTHTHTHAHTHKNTHSHTHKNTKAVLDRLARAIGHLEKVRLMVEDGEDCSAVLIQLSAVKSAINNTGKLILKDHMEHCMVEAVEEGDLGAIEELTKAIDQFVK